MIRPIAAWQCAPPCQHSLSVVGSAILIAVVRRAVWTGGARSPTSSSSIRSCGSAPACWRSAIGAPTPPSRPTAPRGAARASSLPPNATIASYYPPTGCTRVYTPPHPSLHVFLPAVCGRGRLCRACAHVCVCVCACDAAAQACPRYACRGAVGISLYGTRARLPVSSRLPHGRYMVASVQARLVKHRCRMVQRGVHAQAHTCPAPPCVAHSHRCIFATASRYIGVRHRGITWIA